MLNRIDLRPSNVLFDLKCLQGKSEKEMKELIGEPVRKQISVQGDSSAQPGPEAPSCLVEPIDFTGPLASHIEQSIKIIDFGESFAESDSAGESRTFGTPLKYAAPEIVMGGTGGKPLDCWSLGCLIFEVRLGNPIFQPFEIGKYDKRSYMSEVASVLGMPPPEWREFCPELDAAKTKSRRHWTLSKIKECIKQNNVIDRAQMTESEISDLADLLESLLRYDAGKRITAEKALSHCWFQRSH